MPKKVYDQTVSIRMPADLKKRLNKIAKRDRRSLTQTILIMLERYLNDKGE